MRILSDPRFKNSLRADQTKKILEYIIQFYDSHRHVLNEKIVLNTKKTNEEQSKQGEKNEEFNLENFFNLISS